MNEMPTNTQKLSLFSNFTKHLQVCCGLVMLLFLSTLSWEANAQSVTIGVNDGNTTAIPISSCWEFSYTQQIVYASEINAAGDITSISFYYVNGSYDVSTSWDVYLGHTSQTTFASLSDWVDYTALESVFSGTVSFPAEGSWMTITFDNPFTYNGTDNLVIAVDENEPGYNCSINFGRISNVSDSNRGITYRSDSTNPDPASPPTSASLRSNHINVMQLGGIEQSCPSPSLLTAIDINTTTATLEWTENGSATEWEVIYGNVGFDPESEGVEINVNINPEVILTDLSPNTGYDFYVTSICGVDDESERVGPFSFWTNCIATDVPFTQNFEDVTVPAIPNCGTLEVISGNAWKTATVTSYGFSGKVLHYGYTSEEANSWYFTQGLNLETGMNYKISYQYGNNSTSYEEKLKVAYGSSPNAAAMTEEIADHIISLNGSEFNETTFSVTSSGVYYLGFQAHSEANEFHLYLDNIEIIPLVECASVSVGNLVTEDMSVCSGVPFTLEVEEDPEENEGGLSRQWMYSTDGTTWTAIEEATGISYVVADGVSEETQFKYTAACSIDDSYAETDVITISMSPATQCYCDATNTNVEPITRVIFAGIDYTSPAETDNPGYEDFTDISASVEVGGTYSFAGEGNTGGNYTTYFTVWIDWNQNGVFEEDEMTQIGSITNSSGTDGQQAVNDIIVPETALLGETRMRVRKRYNAYSVDPCGSYSYGQTEDYSVAIAEASPWECPELEGDIGDTCDDGDALTENDVITEDCDCVGTPIAVTDNCGFENFDNSDLTSAYSDGSFVGNDGVTWTYVASRDENGDANSSGISGNAIMLRRVADDSKITSSVVSGGISDFSVKLYKGFTGAGDRQVELFVNGESQGLSDPFDDFDEHIFAVDGINITGDIVIEIRNVTSRQVILDDITWTCASDVVVYDCPDLQLNIGDACDDEDESTENDTVTADCECVGTPAEEPLDYCIPEATNSARHINNFSTTGGNTNITNEGTGFSAGGYGDFTDMTVSQVQDNEVDFSVSIVGGTAGFRIWVDWNQDGEFDVDTEVAYASSGYLSAHTGSFTVPDIALPGQTRMRIVSHWLSTSGLVDPCVTGFTYGEFEDYTFDVIPLDDCTEAIAGTVVGDTEIEVCTDAPFSLSVEGNSEAATGLLRTWQSSPAGEDTWTDMGISSSTINVAGIDVPTDYRYYVTCENGDSDISAVISISLNPNPLECYCVPSTNTTYYVNSFSTSGGVENITNSITEAPVGGYADFSAQLVSQYKTQEITFTATMNTSTHGMKIWVDWNQDGSFSEEEIVYQTSGYLGTFNGTIVVPENAIDGITRMRVGTSFSPSSGPGTPCESSTSTGIAYQDYSFEAIPLPSCTEAIAGTVVGDTEMEVCADAPFSLTVEGNSEPADGLIRTWQSSPAGEDTWTDLGVASATIEVDGIDAPTDYRYHVECTNGDSDNSDVISITLNPNAQECYCVPQTNTTYYVNSFSTSGGVENISNSVSSAPVGGYGDFSEQLVSQYKTQEITFAATMNTSTHGMKIWVDWNQDGSFSEEEIVYQTSGYLSTFNGTIVVPENAVDGITLMRVGTSYSPSSGPATPCENSTSTGISYQDYSFEAIPLAGCTEAIAGTVVGDTEMEVCATVPFSLTVEGNSEPADGLIRTWQSSPAGEDTWTDLGEGSSTIEIAGIDAPTDYRYHVECTNGDSDNSDVISITLNPNAQECYCVPQTNTTYYVNSFSTSGGVENISNSVSSAPVGGYADFTSLTVAQVQTNEINFTATMNTSTHGMKIWVDWNQDGSFSEEEIVYQTSGYLGTFNGTIVVPETAPEGVTRMRVGTSYSPSSGPATPCENSTSTGISYQDYSFDVIALETCADADAGTLVAENMSVCAGVAFTLEVEGSSVAADGLTMQWMSSSDGGLTWDEIEGATSTSYTVADGVSEETQFKFTVSCDSDDSNDETDALIVSMNPANQCYCDATSTNVEPITRVVFAGIDYTSPAETSNPGYEDFTDISASVEVGGTYSFAGEGNTGGNYTTYFTVWIDWNQNGVFEEDEMTQIGSITNSSGTDGQQAVNDIIVPETALLGETRMRVRKRYNAYSIDPCGSYSFGQTEDYTVAISEADAWECPELEGDIGDSCDDGNPLTENDVITEDCECLGTPICLAPELTLATQDSDGASIDCVEEGNDYYVLVTLSGGEGNDSYNISANGGDPVEIDAYGSTVFGPFAQGTDVSVLAVGAQDDDCDATASINSPEICVIVYDCPDLEANHGDECTTDAGEEGVIDENCECYVAPVYDCPELEANHGDECTTDAGEEGVIDENCECYVAPIYDCPDIEANHGDECQIDGSEDMGLINEDCDCVPVSTTDLDGFNFTMYPNPASSNQSITLISNQSIDRYEILDITGKLIDAQIILNQNEITIALRNYSAGMYMLKAYSGSAFSTQKMVVR